MPVLKDLTVSINVDGTEEIDALLEKTKELLHVLQQVEQLLSKISYDAGRVHIGTHGKCPDDN